MKIILKIIIVFFILSSSAFAKQAVITGLRASDNQNQITRLVLDVDKKPTYNSFLLKNPNRLVIDINHGVWRLGSQSNRATSLLEAIRVSDKENGDLRVVFDLKKSVNIHEQFLLESNGQNGQSPYRIVIDLKIVDNFEYGSINSLIDIKKDSIINQNIPQIKSSKSPSPFFKPKSKEKPLIVIDAGHGGKDPGAIGRRKTFEKNITLSYSKELRKQLLKTGKFRVYMTRDKDIFIPLRQRVKKAEKAGGDLFISIHADSAANKKARGLSVYTLSEVASDKQAAALARKENKSDIIGDIDIEKPSNTLNELLIDLVQRDTKNISASFAETIVKNMQGDFKTVGNPHRFAGFRVLTGAKVPSVLLELGYLSNKREEKLLKKRAYKRKLISNLVDAIEEHFKVY